jgi:hypothetical protein
MKSSASLVIDITSIQTVRNLIFIYSFIFFAMACGGGGGGGDAKVASPAQVAQHHMAFASVGEPMALREAQAGGGFEVIFEGGVEARDLVRQGDGWVTVTVPMGAKSGKASLLTATGTVISSVQLVLDSAGGLPPTPNPPPAPGQSPGIITSFAAALKAIPLGGSTTLTGTFTGGTGKVTPGNHALASGAALTVSPTADQDYTLVVTSPAGDITTRAFRVQVVPPAITAFTAAAGSIPLGGAVTLTVAFTGGTGVVTPGHHSLPSGATLTVHPTADQDYTLTVTAPSGATVHQTCHVQVVPPAIAAFTAAAGTIIAGSSTTLTAAFTGGTGVVMPGHHALVSGGSLTVHPIVDQDYTLTVTTPAGASVTQVCRVQVAPPAITAFNAAAGSIPLGGSTALTAAFTGGTGVVMPGNHALASGGRLTVSPTADQDYHLTVTAPSGATITRTCRVQVVPPAITAFTAAAGSIPLGGSATLTAVFTGGTGVVTPGDHALASGSSVTVRPAVDQDYTLTVTTSAGASVTRTCRVQVVPPAITAFTAAADSIIAGGSTTLTAAFTGGTGMVTPGNHPLASGAALTVNPAADQDYTLTVTTSAGASVTRTCRVQVRQFGIRSFTAAAGMISAGGSTNLTAAFIGGTGVVTPGNLALASGATLTVNPAADQTYTLTLTSPAGATATQTCRVRVVPAPNITAFTADAAAVPYGGATLLRADYTGGTGQVEPVDEELASLDTLEVSPAEDTDYTLKVTNAAGTSITRTLRVLVGEPLDPVVPAAVTAAHLDAKTKLLLNLAADKFFMLDGTRLGLTDEFIRGYGVLYNYSLNPGPQGHHINAAYLIADPYLSAHSLDIDAVVPADVPDAEWTAIKATLNANFVTPDLGADPHRHAIDAVCGIIDASALYGPAVRRRVKHLVQTAQARQAAGLGHIQDWCDGLTPLQEIAGSVARQYHRCIDGIREGLDDLENVYLAGDGAAVDPVGFKLSQIAAEYRMAFIKRHSELWPLSGGLGPDNRGVMGQGGEREGEFPTYVNTILKQKMLYSLSLKGQFTPLFYGALAHSNNPFAAADRTMRRFLFGEANVTVHEPDGLPPGDVRMQAGMQRVDFLEPYNVDLLVNLCEAAYERGLKLADGRTPVRADAGPKLAFPLLTDAGFLAGDPALERAFTARFLEMGGDNRYFISARPGESPNNTRVTRDFWIRILMRYGYVVRGPRAGDLEHPGLMDPR